VPLGQRRTSVRLRVQILVGQVEHNRAMVAELAAQPLGGAPAQRRGACRTGARHVRARAGASSRIAAEVTA